MTELTGNIILDVDVGVDDAMAMLLFFYAMKVGSLKILGIVCTSGNTGREHVVKNVVRLLEVTGHTDIPVYRGALRPIIPLTDPMPPYEGIDGFGDLDYDHEPDLSIVSDIPGEIAMRDLVVKNPNNISLVTLGPLTTVALAERLYDDFLLNVKDVWVMGGNYKGIGNTGRGTAEFNFFSDPEAAYIVLNNGFKKVSYLPWEACSNSPIPVDWRFNVLGKSKLPEMQFLTKAEKAVHAFHPEQNFWMCCDGQLAAAYLFPKSVITTNKYNASVELHGSRTRGQVIINPDGTIFNVDVFVEPDFTYFQKLLLMIGNLTTSNVY